MQTQHNTYSDGPVYGRARPKATRVILAYDDSHDLDALEELIHDEDDIRVALCGTGAFSTYAL